MIVKRAKTGIVIIVFLFRILVLIRSQDDQKENKVHKSQKTAFHGMKYLNSYGMPLSRFGNKSFEYEKEDWKAYFPQLVFARLVHGACSIFCSIPFYSIAVNACPIPSHRFPIKIQFNKS